MTERLRSGDCSGVRAKEFIERTLGNPDYIKARG